MIPHWSLIDVKHCVSFHTNKHVNAVHLAWMQYCWWGCGGIEHNSEQQSRTLNNVSTDLGRLQILVLPPAALRRLPFAPLCRHLVLILAFNISSSSPSSSPHPPPLPHHPHPQHPPHSSPPKVLRYRFNPHHLPERQSKEWHCNQPAHFSESQLFIFKF